MNVMAVRLKGLRDQLGYNQEGMAASIKMKRSTWADWEKDPPVQFELLARISQHYGVSADYLLGITDDPAGRQVNLAADVLAIVDLLDAASPQRRREMLAVLTVMAVIASEPKEPPPSRRQSHCHHHPH